MRRDRFVLERRPRWTELEELVDRGRKSLHGLSGNDLFRLGQLYLAATADLATARRDFPDERVTLYLNGLVARAHPIVYHERAPTLQRAGRWLRYGFPRAYRDAGPYIAVSFATFAIAAAIAALLVALHPSTADVLLPGEAQSLRSVMAQHHLWMKGNTPNHPLAANFIMLNNIHVALLAFAGGMLLAAPSILVEAYNGINLGAVAAMVAQYHLSEGFWAFVFPHGFIELSVIFMAGGAGMMIGDSILRPGLARRRDSLVRAARHAVQLLLGGAMLLVIAGTIEGFFSPSNAPDWSKFAVGILSGILLYAYLLGSRPSERRQAYTFDDLVTLSGGEPAGESATTAPAP